MSNWASIAFIYYCVWVVWRKEEFTEEEVHTIVSDFVLQLRFWNKCYSINENLIVKELQVSSQSDDAATYLREL